MFKTLALASVLALSAPVLSFAGNAPKAATTAGAPTYAQLHQGTLTLLAGFRGALSSAESAARFAQLPIELDKLVKFEKTYGEAKAVGKEDDAKAAAAGYTLTAQAIIELAVPMDNLVAEATRELNMAFRSAGPQIEKVVKESDVLAIQTEIETILKPLAEANHKVGPLRRDAVAAAKVRLDLESAQILSDVSTNVVTNYLQGELDK
jgi:hypothetical protein